MWIWPLTCFNIITRRAYSSTDLAVNTSRPLCCNPQIIGEGKVTKKVVHPPKSLYFRQCYTIFSMSITFAVIQERKSPPDKRVVLTPKACAQISAQFPEANIIVETSDIRIFPDQSYQSFGFQVCDDISDAAVLIGVKEVPIAQLIPGKSYFFFSHTIKKQPYNRDLLRAVLEKNIRLYDHETLVNTQGHRIIGFGYYAGVVGAYNGFRAFGLKQQLFSLPKAVSLPNREALNQQLLAITLPAIKIVLTGKGRVGSGAKEILDFLKIEEVSVDSFLHKHYDHAVYVQLDALDYNARTDGKQLGMQDFFDHPENYHSTFMQFAAVADFFIAGHFYAKGAPFLFSRSEAKDPAFKIKVVADISCDVDGPVATTIRASTIAKPIYGYHPQKEKEVDYRDPDAIAVMAVDNLPCELSMDASEGFAAQFVKHVIPAFFNGDASGILARALMTEDGQLTPAFSYLQDYVDGI